MSISIKLIELELLIAKLFSKLRKEEFEEFEFIEDPYWIIHTEEWSNFNETPKPAVGSLEDDVKYLKEVINNDEYITYLELERLASVLRAMSKQLLS